MDNQCNFNTFELSSVARIPDCRETPGKSSHVYKVFRISLI